MVSAATASSAAVRRVSKLDVEYDEGPLQEAIPVLPNPEVHMGSDQWNPLKNDPPPWESDVSVSGSGRATASHASDSASRACARASSRYPAALVSAVAKSLRASVSTA